MKCFVPLFSQSWWKFKLQATHLRHCVTENQFRMCQNQRENEFKTLLSSNCLTAVIMNRQDRIEIARDSLWSCYSTWIGCSRSSIPETSLVSSSKEWYSSYVPVILKLTKDIRIVVKDGIFDEESSSWLFFLYQYQSSSYILWHLGNCRSYRKIKLLLAL